MRRAISTLLTLLTLSSSADAASSINPNSPAQDSSLKSSVVRNNFLAAYNDVNNILGCYAGASPPVAPVNLQSWCDTSASPNYVFKYRNTQTNTWVPYGTLNVNTGVWSPYASPAAFAAIAPLVVGVSAGITTYSLNIDSRFSVNGSSQLALANVASGQFLANCTVSPAEPGGCAWTTYADLVIGATNGLIPYRTGGSWGSVSVGTSGASVPLLNGINTYSGASIFSAGLTVNTSFAATGLVGLTSLAPQASNTIVANVSVSPASPTAIVVPGCTGPANALQWVTNTGPACAAITAPASSITTGTTLVSSGVTSRVLFNNAGTLGEYTITGTGSVVMSVSPTFTGTVLAASATLSGALSSGVLTVNAGADNTIISQLNGAGGNSRIVLSTDASGNALIRSGNTVDLRLGTNASTWLTITNAGVTTLAGATTLSSALTYGGVTLSNAVSGTGAMALATAPTLTNPVVGTQTFGNNTTLAASTAFVQAAVVAGVSGVASLNTFTGSLNFRAIPRVFTSTTTWTPTSGTVYAVVECQGGGGGGGGNTTTTSRMDSSGGGGGGGYSRVTLTAAQIGASKSVTIGAGGAGGIGGSTNGSAGGDTCVGGAACTTNLCVGKGGGLALTSGAGIPSPGGLGGVAGTGDLLVVGGGGGAGTIGNSTTQVMSSGTGGNAVLGGGGAAVTSTTGSNGVAGANYGGGGSGSMGFNSGSLFTGGAGAQGVVYVTEFVIN